MSYARRRAKPPPSIFLILFMKHLIFLDIDGTLIQPNQKPNTNRLPSVIKRLSRKGVLFALNSNRSLEDVERIYRKFSLNGPMILENGVYFIDNGKRRMLIKIAKPVHPYIVKIVKNFVERNKLECKVLFTDTVRVIESRSIKTIPLIILVNRYRKYTASIHIYRHGAHDKILSQKLVRYIRRRFYDEGADLHVESPKAFGNVVVFPNCTDKGKALKEIKKYYPGYVFYMVGDDSADLETLREVESFFAVGNAQQDVQKKARYISSYRYTKGVVDILEYFEKIKI